MNILRGVAFRDLGSKKLSQPRLRDLGHDNQIAATSCRRRAEHDLIANVCAEPVKDLDDLVEARSFLTCARTTLLPPLPQHSTLRKLLLKQLIGLLQCFSIIGNTSIDDCPVGDKVEQMRLIPKIGELDALQLSLEL